MLYHTLHAPMHHACMRAPVPGAGCSVNVVDKAQVAVNTLKVLATLDEIAELLKVRTCARPVKAADMIPHSPPYTHHHHHRHLLPAAGDPLVQHEARHAAKPVGVPDAQPRAAGGL